MQRHFTLYRFCVSLLLLTGSLARAGELCFTAQEDGSTIKLTLTDQYGTLPVPTLEYTQDSVHWLAFPLDSTFTLAKDSSVWIRGNNTSFNADKTASYVHFIMSGKIAASGNVMSLLDKTCQSVTIPSPNCFAGLFSGCGALTSAPELPAMKLNVKCYDGMFAGCNALKSAPVLPADSMAYGCYCSMFQNCTALTTAPELPATKLAGYCYQNMFTGCSKLTQSPLLPATTLAQNCYESMFSGCTTLNRIEVLFNDWNETLNATNLWGASVASSGLFVCPADLSPLTNNDSKVPVGWTVRHPVYWDSLTVALSKVYDYNRNATITNMGQSRGFRPTDNVNLTVKATYDTKNVATGKPITVAFTLTGSDAYRYIKPDDYVYSTQGSITPKPLSASGVQVVTERVYNGNAKASITQYATLSGVLGSDEVSLSSQTATYNDKTAATGKTITVNYGITGADAYNYTAPSPQTYTTQGVITPKPVTLSGLNVQTVKDFDYSDSAHVISQYTISGMVAGDKMEVYATANYDNKYIGTGKTITVNLAVTGVDADNYKLNKETTFVYTTAGKINGRYIQVQDIEIDSVKTYDGTDEAAVLPTYKTIISHPEDSTEIHLAIRAWYDHAHVGSGKIIRYALSLSGAMADQYWLQDGDTLIYPFLGTIEKRPLYADGAQVVKDKMYDTTDEAEVTAQGMLHNVVEGDQITMLTVANYETADPKKYQEITVRYTVSGDTADYLAPMNEMFYGSIYDSIRLESDFYENQLCEGQELIVGAFVSRGAEDLYRSHIYWGDAAHRAGLFDADYTRFTPDHGAEDRYEFYFIVPDTIRDGLYSGTIRLDGPIEGYYEEYPIMIRINGSRRLLDNIFADVISIDNREERFVRYQWQRLNEETYEYEDIPGATLPYYQEVGGLNGCYRVLLNAGMEDEVLTCERCFELSEQQMEVSVRKELRENQVIIILPTGENYNAAGQNVK